MSPTVPRLTGIVVHWHNEEQLARLLAAWPADPRFELVVVDNGSSSPLRDLLDAQPSAAGVHFLDAGRNLGFAGAVNAGVEVARAPVVLLLNPDAEPVAASAQQPAALEALLAGLERYPDAAGLAPRLLGVDGVPQHAWQLRPLPRPWTLLLQTLLLPAGGGARVEPVAGARVEQPAAAVLLLRKEALRAVGGMDEGFQPAWFEDVDLARRLWDAGLELRYHPLAVFRHELGGTVPRLGYGRFLWIYYRNLQRYLAKHHRPWHLLVPFTTTAGMLLRLCLLPLRCPRRAASRRQAAQGLLQVIAGALTGWRYPGRMQGPREPS